jgi:hypothetical protein
MWVARELVRLVVRIVVMAAVAAAIAAVLALATGGGFDHSARILFIAIGCVVLAMGGVGTGSNVTRFMDTGVQQAAWGNIPGFDALRPRPEDPTIAPGAAFFCSGLVLIALGVAVF